jgi:putative Ca2+/H+ antiporter (TMEM165/GDT1 family)
MTDFWPALILVFASEMGDKSQIVSFGFGTQQRLIVVLPAIFLGIALMLGVSALIGQTAGAFIPSFWMHLLSGLLFFVFAYLSFRGQHEDIHKPVGTNFGAFITVFLTFVISELGDKTIFATMTLASHSKNFLAVWFGSTLGMFGADLLAIAAANLLGKALPAKGTRIASGIVFVVAGIWTVAEVFAGKGSL